MRHNYKTKNICATHISFDLDGDVVRNVEFTGGCDGNLKVIPKLVEGFTVEQITAQLGGILCGRRLTSCADQLAIAVQNAYAKVCAP
jgi:uncharacterized protein (TIGR03905 family)